jgi:trimeric autotransporter adhesin
MNWKRKQNKPQYTRPGTFINDSKKADYLFMKKKLLVFQILFMVSYCSFSQGVGIGTNTPDASAALDIRANNKGLLIPRMNITSINAIIAPARGLLVYDSIANQLMVNTGTAAAPNWQPVAAGSNSGWSLSGNSGTNPASQFIGNTDNQPLRFRVNNIQAGELNPASGNISWGLRANTLNTTGFSNIALGTDALKTNTERANLVAIGDSALFHNKPDDPLSDQASFNTAIGSKSLFTNTIGSRNTAAGYQSLFSNTSGTSNTAVGRESLFSNTAGSSNTAVGDQSLRSNSTGSSNTTVGLQSLFSNTTGNNNTAVGEESLISNTTGNDNTAIGLASLSSNINGRRNTATGSQSLFSNSTGSENTAIGNQSLTSNLTGDQNTAVGENSLFSNTTGSVNTAVGHNALEQNTAGSGNTALGDAALSANVGAAGQDNTAVGNLTLFFTPASASNTAIGSRAGESFNMGSNNTMLGASADISQDGLFNCVAIGKSSTCTASNQVRLGNSSTTSIGGIVGFSNLSDGRYKKNIQEAVKGIDFIMKLRPVTYQLDMAGINKKLNINAGKMDDQLKRSVAEQEKTVFSGFVAQEVEQASKAAGYDFSGVDKPKNENDMYGLRYAEFVVPLVKAMQEQQQMIIDLKKQNEDLQKRVLALEKK